MKLQFTTLLYLISNVILITLRTVQIIFFTEAESAFLKPSFAGFNILFIVLAVLLLLSVFINALYKPRMPKDIKAKSVPCAVISAASGILYILSGIFYVKANGTGTFFLVISVLAALTCFLYGFTEFSGFEFPRAAALILIGVWVYEFVLSYLFYSTRPLRSRTVLETLAMTATILFFIAFGKLKSGVKQTKNIRLLYPLGLIASTLCFVSLVPEAIAFIFGQSAKVSESCVSKPALLAAGIFTAFISLYCFKKQPPKIRNIEEELTAEEMPFYMESANLPEDRR